MKEYQNISLEYKEFIGLGLNEPVVKASLYNNKFTLLARDLNMNEVKLLLDEVYRNMASELRRQIRSYPDSWLKVEYKNTIYRYHDIRIASLKSYIPKKIGSYKTLSEASANGVHEYLFEAIENADDQALVHAIGNNRLFCTNGRPNAYVILENSENIFDFFDSFMWNYFPSNASNKKRWTGSYFTKLCEAMCLKNWLLYPLMQMSSSSYYFFDPSSGEQYSNSKSESKVPFINKVFVNEYNTNRLTNFIGMSDIISKHKKADSDDCIGFMRRLTFMTDATDVQGLSEEICIHLTNATLKTTLPKSDAPVERLVNDYIIRERKVLRELPDRVFVYEKRKINKESKDKELKRYKGEFNWVSDKNITLKAWGELFTEYSYASNLKNIKDVAKALNPILDWLLLLSNDEINDLVTPSMIIRNHHIVSYHEILKERLTITLIDYLRTRPDSVANSAINEFEKFCIWYAKKYDIHFEIPVNPSDRRQFDRKSYNDKSNKEVIPTQLFRLMKDILTDNDYEWAKSIDGDWTGKESGKGIWCPSRAYMLETLMILPIRYDNVMSADLGLNDEIWFDHHENVWVPNLSGIKGRSSGFLKLISDGASGDQITGFYFAKDKIKDHGMTVTWENPNLINTLIKQRKFIIENNCVHDFRLDTGMSEKGANRLLYKIINPLFIDYAHRDFKWTKSPVSYERFNDFFKLLQVEAERRFNNTQYGRKTPIRLIIRAGDNKTPKETLFTPHCLRVTGITQFAIAGLPPSVIAEALSGHHSLVMNLYYTKFTPSLINKLISEKVNEIELKFDLISLDDWKSDVNLFRRIIEVNSESSAFQNIENKNIHFMTLMDGFICPNGASQCAEGYINTAKGAKHSEVSGGKGNCPNCRFAMTGPMLLNQQVLAANQKLYDLEQLVKKQKSFVQKAEEFHRSGYEFGYHEQLKYADSLQPEIESKMDSWLSRYSFIHKSAQKLPAWDMIQKLRESGRSTDEIKAYLKSQPTQQIEKTLITNSTSDELKVVFETCDTKAEIVAINACAEQIMPISKTTCTDKLINYMTKALISVGSEPFFYKLDEFNSSRAAILHAQFLTKYFQAYHERQLSDNLQYNSNSAVGRIEMGKFLDNPNGNVLPIDFQRAWDLLNSLLIKQGSCSELPLSLDVFLKDKQSLFSDTSLRINHESRD